MKVALCCIGRLENQYAREFVEHYKKLGFDKIFIYDNNHDGEEHFEDVLQDYVDFGFVDVIPLRNIERAQLGAYNDCYSKHKDEYDWIAFFDFDEFLVLENYENITSFLSQKCFDEYQCILFNWMIMDDNGLVYNDHRPLMERFTHPMQYDKQGTYAFPENNHVKSIVRGGYDVIFSSNPHVPSSKLLCCDAIGRTCNSSPFKKYDFQGAYLKHFFSKTIEEWLKGKMKRGASDRTHKESMISYNLDRFFVTNEKTEEKLNFVKRHFKHLLENDVKIFICTHKPFDSYVSNTMYEVVSTVNLSSNSAIKVNLIDNVNLPLKDDFFSELYAYKWVNDNLELPKYVGFCHYRRYFQFMNDIPNMDEIFSKYGIILAKPFKVNLTIREQYAQCHNVEDLDIVGNIIKEKYQDYYEPYKIYINGNLFIPYNMFIMKRDDFKEYCNFIFGILNDYLEIVGTDIRKRIEDNKDKYLKSVPPNNSVDYQYRIGSFLAERLSAIFFIKNFKLAKTYPIIITENKYNLKNNKI